MKNNKPSTIRLPNSPLLRSLPPKKTKKQVLVLAHGTMELKPIHGKIIEPKHIEMVRKYLKRGKDKALTMRALARGMCCSKGAAERRFNAFVAKHLPQDTKLKSVPVREGDRGPESVGFYL